MDYETIGCELTDGLAVVTLNRPKKMNALNSQMRLELTNVMLDLPKQARCIVLTGAGRAFCSGQDLSDRTNVAEIDLERTLREEYVPMVKAIYDCPVPTVSAVNGAAAGAGANLALAADIVIAAESAYFMQAFTRIGLLPDAGGTWFMPRQIGLAKAMGASLFADRISARQAEAWGLIWEAAEDDAFEAHWRTRARQLSEGPTIAYGGIKKALRSSLDSTIDEQLATEATLQGECGRSRDFREGVMAFIEKRSAKFEGR